MQPDSSKVVEIPKWLEPIIPDFLSDTRQEIEAMHRAFETNDFAAIREVGHGLKGDGGTHGFDAISEIGRAIEQAAKDEESATITRLLDELSMYVNGVQIVYV